eukprot:366167-Chlamydomonas_euryale.AAC.20
MHVPRAAPRQRAPCKAPPITPTHPPDARRRATQAATADERRQSRGRRSQCSAPFDGQRGTSRSPSRSNRGIRVGPRRCGWRPADRALGDRRAVGSHAAALGARVGRPEPRQVPPLPAIAQACVWAVLAHERTHRLMALLSQHQHDGPQQEHV